MYAWGTNSMGQCGQGHSNGSITTPSKVKGLDGVQVQQISAGTSHSIVWTAVPVDRCVCVCVCGGGGGEGWEWERGRGKLVSSGL